MKANIPLISSIIVGLFGYSTASVADVKVSTGYIYVNGQNTETGLSNVKLSSIPLSLKVKKNALGVKVSTSYLKLDDGSGVTQKGTGDTNLTVSYDVTPKWTVSIKEKFSTGDKAKGLSTGYNDTNLQADYSTPLSNGKSIFGSLAYKIKGGKSNVASYKNAADISMGMSKVMNNNWTTGAFLDYAQSSTTTLKDTTGVIGFTSYKIDKHWSATAIAGYDTSNTGSAGLTANYKF